jgi:hypothetical protein
MPKQLTQEERDAMDAKMEAAADKAWADFDMKQANSTGDGVKAVANWLKANYKETGYNKLCRRLLMIAD